MMNDEQLADILFTFMVQHVWASGGDGDIALVVDDPAGAAEAFEKWCQENTHSFKHMTEYYVGSKSTSDGISFAFNSYDKSLDQDCILFIGTAEGLPSLMGVIQTNTLFRKPLDKLTREKILQS